MNIICNKSSLIKGVGTVIRAVSQKTTMPILQCILLNAEGDVFSLTGNDLELGVYCTAEAVRLNKKVRLRWMLRSFLRLSGDYRRKK